MESIEQMWRALEAWLSATKPALLGELRGPASNSDFLLLEGVVPHPLPQELLDSWRQHDGEDYQSEFVFGGLRRLLPIREAIEQSHDYSRSAKRRGTFERSTEIRTSGSIMPFDWTDLWCPFLLDNTVLYCVDLWPAPGGNVGQVIVVDHEALHLYRVAPDFRTFFERAFEATRLGAPWPFTSR